MKTHNVDVIVIGGGHAGIEAALASARLGSTTLLCTADPSKIGWMPCNPSIGGPAKGQIVGEIDALGGEMGIAADSTHIQLKVLNRSRGPAVQCLRSQNDKFDYQNHMQNKIKTMPLLEVLGEEVSHLIFSGQNIEGVITKNGVHIIAPSVVITTGTFLNGVMHTGLTQTPGGRVHEHASLSLSESLRKAFRLGRLKTGTPPRLDHASIDYDALKIQPGDPEFLHFSFKTAFNTAYKHQIPCYLSETTPETHKIILNNLDRSPLYTNVIAGKGPRYCPSIEDKVVRFKDKPSHHIFIEPEDRHHSSIYPQGLNTSLPGDVQEGLLKSMPGLGNVRIIKYGYAVEYDFVYPDQLKPTLETRAISGLFLAGQINGTSGYEEAAGQGIIAGINAALSSQKRDPFVLTREDSFIGTMIDDLITKNIFEPYRMLTSRSEYRLLLRQDNATFRLSEKAHKIGLLSTEEIQEVRKNRSAVDTFIATWKKTSCSHQLVEILGLKQKAPLSTVAKRPEVTIATFLDSGIVSRETQENASRAMIEIKYEGYISKQSQDIEKIQKIENKPIPEWVDYSAIQGLKKESQEKFISEKPKTIYDAKRIAGINPADILVLIGHIERRKYVSRETPQHP
jgi:tRNA uridine 5-carboxymethylaminomethyl modification enzyme